jgi:hypothetical protein
MEKNAILVENLTFLAKICHFPRKCLGTLEIFTNLKRNLKKLPPSPPFPLKFTFFSFFPGSNIQYRFKLTFWPWFSLFKHTAQVQTYILALPLCLLHDLDQPGPLLLGVRFGRCRSCQAGRIFRASKELRLLGQLLQVEVHVQGDQT